MVIKKLSPIKHIHIYYVHHILSHNSIPKSQKYNKIYYLKSLDYGSNSH